MRHTFLVPITCLLLFNCAENPRESEAYRQLLQDHERVQRQVVEQDSAVNALFSSMNRIGENLRTIQTSQGRIALSGPGVESGKGREEQIMQDLQDIDALLRENQEILARMRREAKASSGRIAELDNAVREWERVVSEKDDEIGQLKLELSSSNQALATLMDMYRDKAQQASAQQEELTAAWYAVGTLKELKANGVITREGGVAGLGGQARLNTNDLARDYFRKIDLERTERIELAGRKPKLVTSHPDGSYRLEQDGSVLIITDATAFWSLSRYLVVVVD